MVTPTGVRGPTPPPSERPTGMRGWVARHRAPLLLVGLAILIPELLTGSTPVLNLLNPMAVLFLIGLYGAGVLTIRELGVRWQRGWGPILCLGAAYGIAEEALGTKTFFVATLAQNHYPPPWGHWLGVNWDWSVQLTVFHAIFSIALPILLVGLVYPETGGRRWCSERQLGAVFGAFALTVGAMFVLFNRQYPVAPGLFVAGLGAIAGWVLLARFVPGNWVRPRTEHPDRPPRSFAWAGGLYGWLSFGISFLLGTATGNVLLTAIAQVLLGAVAVRWLLAHVGRRANARHLVSLATGLISVLFAFAAVEEFVGDWGSALAIAAAVAVLWIAHRAAVAPPLPATPPGVPAGAFGPGEGPLSPTR